MRDYLLDLVEHTYDLGCIDLIKIVGDTSKTEIVGLAEDLSVVIRGNFHNPVADFVGTFGMPNLGKLNTVLNIPEYKEDAKLSISMQQRNGADVPVGITFENKAGDFKNEYRFMTNEIVNDKLKSVKMKNVKWSVEFNPTAQNILRLKFQASANSDENTFTAKTENNQLKFFFGDHSSHAGNFVFHDGITSTLTKAWAWPVTSVIAILGLAGDKSMKISDEGVMQITIDSGIAEYNYLLPAQQK